ncbi:MAG: PTS sugar transporter subunit IIA [Nitrospinae bacterium]|nr:PTS sugar transporter subunit IIA [Nitrospinota bacterium]
MLITDYLSEDLILTGMPHCAKEEALGAIVDHLIKAGRITPDRRQILLSKIMERENLSSTGIGGGVAIPHTSGENVENMIVAVGQSPQGVEFESLDGEPVNVIFLIVGSERAPRTHLQILATIVRLCKTDNLIKSITSAQNASEIFGILSGTEVK